MSHPRHIFLASHGIFVVFKNALHLLTPVDRRIDGPDRVGIQAQRCIWAKGLAQRQN